MTIAILLIAALALVWIVRFFHGVYVGFCEGICREIALETIRAIKKIE